MESFRAYRIFEENGRSKGRLVDMSADELDAGEVLILDPSLLNVTPGNANNAQTNFDYIYVQADMDGDMNPDFFLAVTTTTFEHAGQGDFIL